MKLDMFGYNPRGISCDEKLCPENAIQILKMKHGELCKWVASSQSDVTLLERRLNARGA